MTPSELLFKQLIDISGKQLFNSQTELVKEIISIKDSDWSNKNFNSVRAFVNQVVNGERKLSPNLKNAIEDLLVEKVGTEEAAQMINKIEIVFNDYFELQKNKKTEDTNIKTVDSNDFYLLEKRGLVADKVLVTTREPGIVNNKTWSDEIKKQMLKKLGVINSENIIQASYRFYFPHPDITGNKAFQFWNNLYNFLKYELKVPEPVELIKNLNNSSDPNGPKLQVFHAPELLVSFPIIVYDISALSEVAFTVFGYEDKGEEKISTARIAPDYLLWWKESIFKKLIFPQEPNTINEVSFDTVYEDIKKNATLL
ncbi:MAG: hypothetical protein CMO01_30330 [Thalassobius sp.]|nr:hypothetical protein [Thalassovita sp.]